tara:strand:- start:335 stop:823 length:489 start_codon:yes stop_codon:yes gene_type:complete
MLDYFLSAFRILYFNIFKIISMSGNKSFNQYLWNIGKQIEDELLPKINTAFNCDFKRSDDVFDILDFKDDARKRIVEVKGRRNTSTQYKDTIITVGKLTESLMKMEVGYKVYFFFVFTDKTMFLEVNKDFDYPVKVTGTNHIPHYLIPVKDLIEFDENNLLE